MSLVQFAAYDACVDVEATKADLAAETIPKYTSKKEEHDALDKERRLYASDLTWVRLPQTFFALRSVD